jgi:hypothetical protein
VEFLINKNEMIVFCAAHIASSIQSMTFMSQNECTKNQTIEDCTSLLAAGQKQEQ